MNVSPGYKKQQISAGTILFFNGQALPLYEGGLIEPW